MVIEKIPGLTGANSRSRYGFNTIGAPPVPIFFSFSLPIATAARERPTTRDPALIGIKGLNEVTCDNDATVISNKHCARYMAFVYEACGIQWVALGGTCHSNSVRM